MNFNKFNQRTDHLRELTSVVERYAASLADGVQMLDFGDSVTSLPIPDPKGSYMTSSICFLMKSSTGQKITADLAAIRREPAGVFESNGVKYIGVEFTNSCKVDELQKLLDEAKEKLLAA